MKFSNWKNIFS